MECADSYEWAKTNSAWRLKKLLEGEDTYTELLRIYVGTSQVRRKDAPKERDIVKIKEDGGKGEM